MKAPEKYYQGKRVRFVRPDKEWLQYQYWQMGKSLAEIAREQDTTRHTIMIWLIGANIPRRTRNQCSTRHSKRMSGAGNPAWNGGTSRNYHANLIADRPQICEWCGTTSDIQIHHQDHNTVNGSPDNLALLCGICNRLEAHLWALQQSGRARILIDKADHKIEINFTQMEE